MGLTELQWLLQLDLKGTAEAAVVRRSFPDERPPKQTGDKGEKSTIEKPLRGESSLPVREISEMIKFFKSWLQPRAPGPAPRGTRTPPPGSWASEVAVTLGGGVSRRNLNLRP